MVRQWRHYQGDGGGSGSGSGSSSVEEVASLVFMLSAVLLTLSLFAATIFFCADGVSKGSTKASAANGSNCGAAGGCGGAGCGGGCGG